MSEKRTLALVSVWKSTDRTPSFGPCADVVVASAGQVGKVLGERWKALNEKQRQPYEAKAAADKKRYEDEKASYNVSSEPVDGQRRKRTVVVD